MKDELLSFLSPSAIHLDSNDQYYLFYDCGQSSFHSPIQKKALDKFSDLTIVNIGDLKTQGKDIHDLVSLQFVKKLIELLQSGNFKYLDSNEISESKE